MKQLPWYQQKVYDQVASFGGFSIFWVSDNQRIAVAADRLISKGVIVPVPGAVYPWCKYNIHKKKETE